MEEDRTVERGGPRSKTVVFRETQMDVHRLDRCTAGTLAEVIESGDQNRLRFVGEDKKVHLVRVVTGLHIEVSALQRIGIAQWLDLDKCFVLIAPGQRGVHAVRRGASA